MSCNVNQEFCLKYSSHEKQFSKAFTRLLEEEHLVDVTLACGGESIRAHKTVLSAFSVYFRSLLSNINHSHPIIYLKDVNFSVLEALVKFMYQGEVNIKHELLSQLLDLADSFQVKGLARNEQHNVPPVIASQSRADHAMGANFCQEGSSGEHSTTSNVPSGKRKKSFQSSNSPEANQVNQVDPLAVKTECIDLEGDEMESSFSQDCVEEIESAEELNYTASQLLSEITQNPLATPDRRTDESTSVSQDYMAESPSATFNVVQLNLQPEGHQFPPTLYSGNFRKRFSWADTQLQQLEEWYNECKYPPADTMYLYAEKLAQMFPQWPAPTQKSINNWFQNKRRLTKARMRSETANEASQ